MLQIEEKLLDLLKSINPKHEYSRDTLLIKNGLLDSLEVIKLINGIENVFLVEIPIDEMEVDNFQSVAVIEAFINRIGYTGK